jgi:hypothetical protein
MLVRMSQAMAAYLYTVCHISHGPAFCVAPAAAVWKRSSACHNR